ncbi:flowering time control protein FCA isoform X2 [Vitis vinifera]|uniref:flowering time control protein FCA isoform X2 n=1 Tax=Vitis vinifera TaxID=29760 RepID=UPI0008FF976A|nr:flowering time control protein FCA isoform X2 [Vitis vinifera]|eukprot:XP_019075531.1 PREDICTED: flowering time control protein FCA isoform X2 [Vitis vinifera]
MDRHRGDRYGNNPDSHHYRHSRGPSRSSDASGNHHRRSPSSYRVGFSGGGGGGGGGHHHRPFDSPPRYPPGGAGLRPMGGGGGGFASNYQVPLSGQKRGFGFPGRGGSPDRYDGGGFAKLFVGSVPRTATEEDIRPLFEEHGNVLEVALIKDKRTGQQQGCCFIKYATSEEAERAIRALHNQYTLPGGVGPIQVRYADGERERLVEYKLFVGSLNKQATEKEVKEIFSPYGQVEDVYLMRDELKQSRGCGFVKFSHRDMAMAAINALNGIYTMRGCDQPLTVRFADPKRPRPGESRGAPAFGGPGFGPRFQAPGVRPTMNQGDPIGSGRIPPNAWRPMSPQNLGPSSNAGIHGFGNQSLPRSGDGSISSTPGVPLGGLGGSADGSLSGIAVSSSATSQQSFNQPMLQVPSIGEQISPLQKSLQSPQHLPPSLQLQSQTPASYTQPQTPHSSLRQFGQLQISHSAGQTPFNQTLPSQQLLGLSGQLSGSQPQVQQSASSATAQQTPVNLNLQQHAVSVMANQHQVPAPSQQQLVQPLHQSPSQLAQLLSQQTQALQASFQSSQQAFSQLQQQLQLMQPSNQTLTSQQGSQTTKQQWPGTVPQTVASTATITPATDVPSTTSAVPVTTQAVAPVKCNWTEHTSPDGYKYYHNSVTGESRWEKPEELTLLEQQQQQQKSSVQQSQAQSHTQVLSTQQIPQAQQVQLQTQLQAHLQAQLQSQLRQHQQMQQPPVSSSYQASGVMGQQNVQELGYAQAQVGASSVNDPARFQQGLQAAQEWMWKNKPAGS